MAQEILKLCMSKGFLLDKEMLGIFSGLADEGARKVVEALGGIGIKERVISKILFQENFEKIRQVLISEEGVEEIFTFFEESSSFKRIEEKKEKVLDSGNLKFLSASAFPQKKIEVKDFVNHFRSRYEMMRKIFEERDFEYLTSIRKIGMNRGNHTVIGCVLNKRMTKNKNLMVEVDDLSGTAVILVNQNKKEVFEKGRELLDDDIVAFSVSGNSEMLFANDIFFPEARIEEKRYSEFDEYVAFISDLHAGSKMFLEENLRRFVRWLNGEEGDKEQKEIARKVRYLIINGDTIDGVGVYPSQEALLKEKTSVGQYGLLADILKGVRKDIKMIMGPGQHDAVWVGEPQPIIGDRWAPALYEIENLYLVPNPSLIEVDGGFKILMYHGGSINRFIDEIPYIRTNFGHKSPTTVVKEFLKRRHLAPMHGAMDYIPCEGDDPLVIKEVPDIITTGDRHRLQISEYNNILLIATSCFQSITPFDEKIGNVPDPAKVPIFNLKTREIKILDFSDEDREVGVEKKEKMDEDGETGIVKGVESRKYGGGRDVAEGFEVAKEDELEEEVLE